MVAAISQVSPVRTGLAYPAPARTACPMCESLEHQSMHRFHVTQGKVRGRFEILQCRICQLRFLAPHPEQAEWSKLYDDEFYFSTGWHYAELAAWVIDRIQRLRRRRVESRVAAGRLLDIGSGDGSFVNHMARHGWEATGLEVSAAAVRRSRQSGGGGHFVLSTLGDFEAPAASFDAITMWQVFEHIPDPVPHLSACRALMRRGGVLVIAVPNIEGLSARLTGSRWWGLDIPRHLVHYTPETLSRIVTRSGFEVLSIRHRSLQYDPYALLHSALDWGFSRRHFLSDFAKRRGLDGMGPLELTRNLAVLLLLGPILAPLSLIVTSVAAWVGRGGFIELHARRV